jgi:hypothetical protein
MTTPHQKRFVAHFDMLGMRAATFRNEDIAWEVLSELNAAKEEAEKLTIDVLTTKQRVVIKDRLRTFIFSDTIVIFSLSDEDQDLLAMLTFSCELFKNSLHSCIPLRGGIAHGTFFFNFDKNLFLGKALICAHDLGEEAQWYGITVDKEIFRKANSIPFQTPEEEPGVIEWRVPLKSGKQEKRYVVNWPSIHKDNFTMKLESAEDLYSPFRRLFGEFKNLREHDRKKHKNTFGFIERIYE